MLGKSKWDVLTKFNIELTDHNNAPTNELKSENQKLKIKKRMRVGGLCVQMLHISKQGTLNVRF